jgi:Fe-S-cluster containining protein
MGRHDPATLVPAAQQRLDQAICDWLPNAGSLIYCGRGCSNCCTLNVATTFAEAQRLANHLDTGQRHRIAARVTELLELLPQTPDLKSFLRAHRDRPTPCPLLDADGACSVYAQRPLACRALLSTRDRAWCATDFATLHPLERQAFISSLDPAVVAFPTHYARVPREIGETAEDTLLAGMHERFGFALSGNLCVLLLAETEHCLSDILPRGREATALHLAAAKLDHPFLVTIHD